MHHWTNEDNFKNAVRLSVSLEKNKGVPNFQWVVETLTEQMVNSASTWNRLRASDFAALDIELLQCSKSW